MVDRILGLDGTQINDRLGREIRESQLGEIRAGVL